MLQDLRFAFRLLRRSPLLTAVALVSLALGIGANTAIFTLLDQVLLRALPVRDPGELVLFITQPMSGFVATPYGNEVSFSWPKYTQLRERVTGFSGLIARFPVPVNLAWQGQTDPAGGELVSGNYFEVLGVRPALGRLLSDADDRTPGGHPVAVLSYGYWMRRFGGNPAILKQTVVLNGHAFTVVGVAQPGFRSVGVGEAPGVFVPITMKKQMTPGWDELNNAHAFWLNIFGRLKPGVRLARAEAEANVAWRGILKEDIKLFPRASASYRARYVNFPLRLQPAANGISSLREYLSGPLMLLMAMVGVVLLTACANVANLLLARAATRQKEIAIRASLGASRWRLTRQMLAESVLLALGGGVLGLLVGWWTGPLLLGMLPGELPLQGITAEIDARVLAFALAVSALTGILFGSAPALRASGVDLAGTLKEQAGTLPSAGQRFRQALAAGQIALSVLLLAVAGLFAHSLYNLRQVDPGFRHDHLTGFSVRPDLNGYSRERAGIFFSQLRQELLNLPGISGVTMAQEPLLAGSVAMNSYRFEGYQPAEGERTSVHQNAVGPEFFHTMGIPLLAGRDFLMSDTKAAPQVAVINESLARKYFAGRNPLGLHLTPGRDEKTQIEIVGVARDSKYDELKEKPKPFLYLPAAQGQGAGALTFYVRSRLESSSLGRTLRERVAHLDANLPVLGPFTMQRQIDDSVFLDRMVAALAAAFALMATLLAAIGLYAVVAWAVARRTREIGVRMALGAGAGDVLRMVMSEVVRLAAWGIAIALPAWIVLARVLQSLLYGVSAADPLAPAAALTVLLAATLAAGFFPAFRAARVDPISAIRYE